MHLPGCLLGGGSAEPQNIERTNEMSVRGLSDIRFGSEISICFYKRHVKDIKIKLWISIGKISNFQLIIRPLFRLRSVILISK